MTARVGSLLRLVTALCVAIPAQSQQADAGEDLSPNSDITLVAERTGLQPGASTTVALRITMDPGWHTYWTNPGDAGLPLNANWTLPAGVTVSALRYPVPHVLPQPPLMSYGYERELLVLADLTVAASVPVGTTLRIEADVDFLVCADVCLPASGHVALAAPTTIRSAPSSWATAIADTRARLVAPATGWQVRAWRDGAQVLLLAQVPAAARNTLRAAYIVPDSTGVLEHAAVQQVVVSGDTLLLAVTVAKSFADTVSQLSGVLLHDVEAPTIGTQLHAVLLRAPPVGADALRALLDSPAATHTGGAATTGGANGTSGTAAPTALGALSNSTDMSVWLAIGLAFVGGLLLNLMPCVFPVLSIKILSFVERGGDESRGSVGRSHAMVFTVGVLTTFWVLAGSLYALRAGGAQLGWGFQLQSPAVVTVLALVVFALALNLSGVFTMGMSFTRLGAVGGGERYADSFLTGLLAVIVATPCTAPFMGAALGYALTQHAAIGLAVFTALGVGLAAPYIVLASNPTLLRKLPRPGPWLETLKQLLAFPLYATVVWLLWVLGRQAGADQLALALLVAVVVAFVAWMAGRAQLAGRALRSTAALVGLVLSIAGGGALIASQPAAPPIANPTPAGWEPWSAARVAAARAAGQAVLVDFTAAWCLSCQVNERVVLHTDGVQRAFTNGNVVLLRADWTSRDAEITKVLASFGRSGVPLYVVYPAGTTANAEVLSAVLTPGEVLQAITRATASPPPP